jgi:hypothetical protein
MNMKKIKEVDLQRYTALCDMQDELERKLNLIRVEAAAVHDNLTALELSLEGETAAPHSPVTDHAALRYLERKMNVDVDRLKREIVNGREALILAIRHGRIKTPEGYTLVIRNSSVVTIL